MTARTALVICVAATSVLAGAGHARTSATTQDSLSADLVKAREGAAVRFRGEGMWVEPSELEASVLDDGSIVVVPKGTVVQLEADGSLSLSDDAVLPPSRLTGASPSVGPWTAVNSGAPGSKCMARITRTSGAWIDMCFQIFKMSNDGNNTYDFYNTVMRATMGAPAPGTFGYWIKSGYVRAQPQNTAATWQDWEPTQQLSGSCSTSSYSVAVGGLSYSENWERCETWTPTKSANGTKPDMKNTWSGTHNATRAVNLMMGYRVGQGANGGVTLNWNVSGCHPLYGCD